MAQSPKQFVALLNQAFDRIKKSGQTKELTKAQLAAAIGVSVHLIEYWQRGNCPADHTQTETAGKFLFDKKGLINKEEITLFLSYAGHPSPTTVWDSWFVKIELPPTDVSDIFIGRERKVEELRRALQPGWVVVLWGAGGVGKSSLVREVIQKLAPNNTKSQKFPDGILYYDFYGSEHTADGALQHIADFFGIEVTKDLSPRDAANRALDNKQALIVLDGAEEADDLRKVLRIRHQCGILIVSRYEYLDLSNETIYLDILSPDEAIAVLRAWSVDKEHPTTFQVWGDNDYAESRIACEICEELGRLPLALRLAGRYMLHPGLKPAKFLEYWREWCLSLLNSPHPHQHDSLQILMKKSLEQVERVSEGTGEVIAVAGLLSYQAFSTDVIAAALKRSGVEKLLQDLWKFSLVIQPSAERWQVVHRLIYTYIQHVPIPEEVVTQLATYYITLATEQGKLGLEGYEKLNTERTHILVVLNREVEREKWEEVLKLSYAMYTYLDIQGFWTEKLVYCEAGLKAAQKLQNQEEEGNWSLNLGGVYMQLGQLKDAVEYFQHALTIAREIGNLQIEGAIVANMGNIHSTLGEMQTAIDYYQHALEIFHEIDNHHGKGKILLNLAGSYNDLGQIGEAIDYCQKGLVISRELGERQLESLLLSNLGLSYYYQKQVEHAVECFQQGLTIAREIGDRPTEGKILGNLGHSYTLVGETAKAIDHYEQALSIAKEIGDLDSQGTWLQNLAVEYEKIGQIKPSIEYTLQALAIGHKLSNRLLESECLASLGGRFASLGRMEIAIDCYRQAVTIQHEIGNLRKEATSLHNLGLTYSYINETTKAIDCYEQSLAIAHEIDNRHDEGVILYRLGKIYGTLGQMETAIDYCQKGLIISRELGERDLESILLGTLGLAYYHQGQAEQGVECFQQALVISREISNRLTEGEMLANLGHSYILGGQTARAIDHYEQALAIFEESDSYSSEREIALSRLGFAYYSFGHYEKAIKTYQKMIELKPHDSVVYNHLGDAYLALRRLAEAADSYHQHIELHLDNNLASYVNAYTNLGIITRQRGEETKSLKYFGIALSLLKGDILDLNIDSLTRLLENKALILLGLGQEELAIFILQEALTQRLPSEKFDLTRYTLLAQAPNPPLGVAEMRRLVEKTIDKSKR